MGWVKILLINMGRVGLGQNFFNLNGSGWVNLCKIENGLGWVGSKIGIDNGSG